MQHKIQDTGKAKMNLPHHCEYVDLAFPKLLTDTSSKDKVHL